MRLVRILIVMLLSCVCTCMYEYVSFCIYSRVSEKFANRFKNDVIKINWTVLNQS